MKMIKGLLAIFALVAMAACASTAKIAETPSVSHCLIIDSKTSLISATNGVNLPGISIPAMASQTLIQGDGDCNALKGPDGLLAYAGQQFTQNADIREKMITGAFGIAQSATNGVLAAKVMSDAQNCKGNNCGGPSIYVQGGDGGQALASAGSEANAGATIDIDGALGNPCGTVSCGSIMTD